VVILTRTLPVWDEAGCVVCWGCCHEWRGNTDKNAGFHFLLQCSPLSSSQLLIHHLSLLTVVLFFKHLDQKLTDFNNFWYTTALSQEIYTFEGLRERSEHIDIFLFPPITQWCPISDVLFTGGRGVSDFSVLKYY